MKIVSADFAYGPSGDHSVVMIGLADWQRLIARLRELRDIGTMCPDETESFKIEVRRDLAIELLAMLGEE